MYVCILNVVYKVQFMRVRYLISNQSSLGSHGVSITILNLSMLSLTDLFILESTIT